MLPSVFKSIDLLQELLEKVRANVNEAQKRVDAAEEAYASSLSVTKLFGVFKKTSQADKPTGPFQVIKVKEEMVQLKTKMNEQPKEK